MPPSAKPGLRVAHCLPSWMPTWVELTSMTKSAPLSRRLANCAEKSVAAGVCFSVPTTSTPLTAAGMAPLVAALGFGRQALRNSTSGRAKAASSCRMPNLLKPSLVSLVVTVRHMSAARLSELTGPIRKMYLPGPVESTPFTTSGAAAPAETYGIFARLTVSRMASVSAEEKPPAMACTWSCWAKRVMQAIAFSGLASESQNTISTSGPSPTSFSSSAASFAPSRTSSPCGICSGPKTPTLKTSPPPPASADAPAVGSEAAGVPLSPQPTSVVRATAVQTAAHRVLSMCIPSYESWIVVTQATAPNPRSGPLPSRSTQRVRIVF